MSLFDSLLLEDYRDPHLIWIAARTDRVKGSGTISDPFNGSSIPYPAVNITQLKKDMSGTFATATTDTAHGFLEGDLVTISGVDVQLGNMSDNFYLGTFAIKVLSPSSFTYQFFRAPDSSTAPPFAGGSIQCWREREQFDRAMRSVPPNSLINIGSGIFETKGYHPSVVGGWNPQKGQRIVGSGMGLTTIKLVGASAASTGGQTTAIGFSFNEASRPSGYADGFEVSDLTVDGNVDHQLGALVNCQAISIPVGGRHIRIRRVRVINFGSLGPLPQNPGDKAYSENFAFFAGGSDLVDTVYEDCVAEFPSPNVAWNSTILHMSGGVVEDVAGEVIGMAYSRGNTLRHNYINGQIVYGPMAWLSLVTPDDTNPSLITLTTKTPHGYSAPGNVCVQGVRVGGNLNNEFNGVFKIEGVPTQTQLVYSTYASAPGVPDATDVNAVVGAPVSSHAVPISLAVDSDRKTFHVTTALPHNLTTNNTFRAGGITLNGFRPITNLPFSVDQFDPNNPCNGLFRVANVVSKTEFKYVVANAINTAIIVAPYSFSGDPVIGESHHFMSADNGTGAIVEGNKLLHGADGGPWNDTLSTLDLVARYNYYHDVESAISQNGGDHQNFSMRAAQALTRVGTLATCQINAPGHGLVPGQVVNISGAVVNGHSTNPFNGYQIVESVPDAATFTYEMISEPEADASPAGSFQPVAQSAYRVLEKNVIETSLSRQDGYWAEPTAISATIQNETDTAVIPYAFRRSIIRGNLIRQMDWKTDAYHTGITVRNAEKLLAEKNLIDVGQPQPLRFKKCVAPAFFDNRSPDGRLIQGYDEAISKNLSEVETLLEDIYLLCL